MKESNARTWTVEEVAQDLGVHLTPDEHASRRHLRRRTIFLSTWPRRRGDSPMPKSRTWIRRGSGC
jgi:hypothetical protein